LKLLDKGPRGAEICRRLVIGRSSPLKTVYYVVLDFRVRVGESKAWMVLAQDWDKERALVNAVMNLRVE